MILVFLPHPSIHYPGRRFSSARRQRSVDSSYCTALNFGARSTSAAVRPALVRSEHFAQLERSTCGERPRPRPREVERRSFTRTLRNEAFIRSRIPFNRAREKKKNRKKRGRASATCSHGVRSRESRPRATSQTSWIVIVCTTAASEA